MILKVSCLLAVVITNVSPTDGGWWRLIKTIVGILIVGILIIALLALVFLWVSRNGKPWFVPHVISVYMCKKRKKYMCMFTMICICGSIIPLCISSASPSLMRFSAELPLRVGLIYDV